MKKFKFTQAEDFSTQIGRQRRAAFTLAEVLITLGIIGVVAAMTMSTLITDYREKATVAKLKKIYSTMSSSYLFSMSKYGTLDEWGELQVSGNPDDDNPLISGAQKAMDILTENFKVAKQCGNKGGCFYDGAYKTLGPVDEHFSGTANNFVSVQLVDGTAIATWVGSEGYIYIYVDLDGKAGANTTGKDAFWFVLTKDRLLPAGINDLMGTVENCLNPIGVYNTSRGCTAWVIYKENLDYLHCSGLSWGGKTKCK